MNRYSISLVAFLLLVVACSVNFWNSNSPVGAFADKAVYGNSLVYITTREGLSSRFGQIEHIHSHALFYNRTLTVVDNTCVHYKDVRKPISLCKIFVFPSTISCISGPVKNIVANQRCTMPYLHTNNTEDHKWLLKPSNFGLESFDNVDRTKQFQWYSTQCSLLYGYYFTLVQPERNTLQIIFQQRYVSLYLSALSNLERATSVNASNIESQLIVFHWRRGDQADRCKRNEDSGVNCESVERFISQVNATLDRFTDKVVYVATNEKDPASIRALRKQGFRTARDIKKGKLARVNSLELFTIELQLMMSANRFVSWGTTGVRHFIETARQQRGKSIDSAVTKRK